MATLSVFDNVISPGIVSISGYHCATGLLGLSNISNQCSRPMPMKLDPIAVQPINSFEPILIINDYVNLFN